MKKDSKEFELYLNETKKIWPDGSMIDYFKNKIQEVVILSDGKILDIEKPRIKKDFCFSYGYCGISTPEQEEFANQECDEAETNPSYFINENLKELNAQINNLKSDLPIYLSKTYRGNCNIYSWTAITNRWLCDEIDNKLFLLESQDDRNRLIEAYERVKASFIKRLNTYLKKYGLTKINAWTFLFD